jgi:hypothetical protein
MAAAALEIQYDGKRITHSQVPAAFLASGLRGLRTYAFALGNEAANDQIKKGNELSFISVDNRRNRSPDEAKRNISWYFNLKQSLLLKAVSEALEMARKLSRSYARESTGAMADSWGLYINGKEAPLSALENVKLGKDGDDVRITSNLPYARYLESGNWAGTKSLQKRLKRAQRQLEGKRVRGQVSVTKAIANSMRRKYPGLKITDLWYSDSPFNFTAGRDRRHPSVVFNTIMRVV